MEVLLIYVVLLIVMYKVAKNQGKDAWRVVIWSFFLTPIIGIFILLLSKPDQKKVEEYQTRHGDLVKCPECAELIKSEAKKCKHCGSMVHISA